MQKRIGKKWFYAETESECGESFSITERWCGVRSVPTLLCKEWDEKIILWTKHTIFMYIVELEMRL